MPAGRASQTSSEFTGINEKRECVIITVDAAAYIMRNSIFMQAGPKRQVKGVGAGLSAHGLVDGDRGA